MRNRQQNQRLSSNQKKAKNFQWYKDRVNHLDTEHNGLYNEGNSVSEYKRMKVNYDLFNNILDLKDFEYVCKPFGAEAGELPAQMVNRDIVSGKIKTLLGMEMKRPFSWKVVATNPEATTRKEKVEFDKIREFVVNQTMLPIRQEIELKYQEQSKGRDLTDEEKQKIQQQIAEETKAATPQEVKKYMLRKYQDPAEVLSHQLLEYLIQHKNMKRKFNNTFKHGLLSAKGVMYVGILNGEPESWNVNSMRFNSDKSPDLQFIEDGEWATQEYRMTPSEILKYFGDELKQTEIDRIYQSWGGYRDTDEIDLFNDESDYDNNTISVLHGVWKSLRKIGFLSYKDDDGKKQLMFVDENYKFNAEAGDIKIDWEWIPEVYETWKIKVGEPIYLKMQPIPGQFKDIDNLYNCKLPYYGVIYDNMNSEPTSLMDRLKAYQYYYNIVMYRLELLLASDKGKKVLMNINMIPDSAGIDIKKWQYFLESTPFMWYDPNEEGSNYADANTVAKVIDLSLVSDIQKYIEIAEYLREQAGRSVGITAQVEGQIGANESVRNTQQNLIQTSHILELYFDLHNEVKKNVLQALLEMAKIAYSQSKPKKLTYILDDMSRHVLDLDIGLLNNSTLGLFVSNSSKTGEIKEMISNLAHAALQNQKIELSDVISVIKQDSIAEAEETLQVAEQVRRDHDQSMQQQQLKANQEESEKVRQREREKFEEEKELVVLKEEEKRKTVVIQSSIMGASFNPDQDKDNNGVNDFIQLARQGLDEDIKTKQSQLDREKFEHQKETDKKKLSQADKKLKQDKEKMKQSQAKKPTK